MTLKTKIIVESLKSGLSQFGLNPKDWRIKRVSDESGAVEIRHREDPDLRFKGQLADGQWRQLEFLGI